MDTRTGEIVTEEEAKRRILQDYRLRDCLVPMELPPTPRQMHRRPPKVGRNEPCPCGSGKKFKRCCYRAKGGE